MKYFFIIALVAVSLRLSAQIETTEARQNTSGQINPITSGKDVKVHGKTKAVEEGRKTTHSGASTPGYQSGSRSDISGQATNSKSLQKGKTTYTKKGANAKQPVPSKNANNKNGSKTNSSTTTSGSGKKDN